MKIFIPLIVIVLSACGQVNKNNNKPVAVGIDNEVYSLDQAASLAVSEKNNQEKLICKTTQKTGTRFSTKSCTTKRQRDSNRAAQHDRLREEQSNQRYNLSQMRKPTDGG